MAQQCQYHLDSLESQKEASIEARSNTVNVYFSTMEFR